MEKKYGKTKIQWLWENMKGYRGRYLIGLGGTVAYNILQLTVPFITSLIVDMFLTGENAAENLATRRGVFFGLVIAMVLITLLRTGIVYGTCILFEQVSQSVLYRIRNYLFRKVQRQDMRFYDTYRTGDLMTRLTGDLDAVRHMIAWVVRTILESLALVSATMVYFFIMDWRLALSMLVIAPMIFVVIILFKRRVGPRHKALREKMANLNTAAQENISGNRVVKAFAREDYEIHKFHECNEAYARMNEKTSLTWLRYFPYMETFANLMPVVLMAVGGVFLIRHEITMGEYAAFSGLVWAVANPMRNLGSIMNEFQRFSAASEKIMEIYYSEPTIVDAANPVDMGERLRGKVEFRNVSFRYEGEDRNVLDGISFVANPGETIAIMGETGCGKSSLIQMIPRFYDPVEGAVLVDDVDVRRMRLYQLRHNIGLATQDVLLYSDTIDGNIAFGDGNLTPEEVKQFARYSAADEFISKMPDGYDTIVGERGVGLSGGQKQRISLARALAIRPSILILDDTTSAVDMETEKLIQESLRNLDFPCTKIIIAQRISTTKRADRILVMENGRITESGTHEELIAKRGYYYNVVQLQTGEEV